MEMNGCKQQQPMTLLSYELFLDKQLILWNDVFWGVYKDALKEEREWIELDAAIEFCRQPRYLK